MEPRPRNPALGRHPRRPGARRRDRRRRERPRARLVLAVPRAGHARCRRSPGVPRPRAGHAGRGARPPRVRRRRRRRARHRRALRRRAPPAERRSHGPSRALPRGLGADAASARSPSGSGSSTTTARSPSSTTTSACPTASRSPPTATPSTASTRSAMSCARGPTTSRTGAVGERRDHVRVDDGYPDGIKIDAAGHLWVAVFGQGEVRRFAPDGTLVDVVRTPGAPQATNLCFAGPDRRTLDHHDGARGHDRPGRRRASGVGQAVLHPGRRSRASGASLARNDLTTSLNRTAP